MIYNIASNVTAKTTAQVGSIIAMLGSGPIGAAAAAVVGALESLGISVKGRTRHLSYDEVMPSAVQFSNLVMPAMKRAYNTKQIAEIALAVKPRFLRAMNERWGMGASLNQNIANSINTNVTLPDALSNQLGLFILWVGTNVDADSSDEYGLVINAYFPAIFLTAITEAGLSLNALKGEASIPVPPGVEPGADGAGDGTGTGGPTTKAGFSPLIALGLIGAVIAVVMKKGR